MAELLLKIEPGAGFDDGDILCAFNARRILCCHAQHVCHVRQAARNSAGLIQLDTICRQWFELTHQYRFTRLSDKVVQRYEIATATAEEFSDTPNGKGEQIDVPLYVSRRRKRSDCAMFGTDGSEIWYGGRVNHSVAAIAQVWSAIEAETPLRQTDAQFKRWPAGEKEKRSHLFLATDDFTDSIAADLESSDTETVIDEITGDEETIVRQKRQHRCNWSERLGLNDLSKERIRDKAIEIDLRDLRDFNRQQIVEKKRR